MVDAIVLLAVAAALLPIFVVLANFAARVPQVGLFAVGFAVLIQWDFPSQIAIASVGGVNVYLPDAICAFLLLAGLINFKVLATRLQGAGVLWILLPLLLGVSAIRGVAEFGLNSAFNEGRLLLLPLASTIWFFSISWERDNLGMLARRFVRGLAWALVLLAAYHAVRYGVGSATSAFIEVGDTEQSGRVLTQLQALAVGCAVLVSFSKWQTRPSLIGVSELLAFVSTVIISQQRTVWIATAVGMLILLWRGTVRGRVAFVWALILAAITLIALTLSGSPIMADLQASFGSQGTYNARLVSWPQLIEGSVRAGLGDVLFGQPLGSGFTRVEPNGLRVTYSPHNWYLLLFLRVGVVGLLLFVSALAVTIMRIGRGRTRSLELALLVATLVFCWSYGYSWVSCVAFGLAVVSVFPGHTSRDLGARAHRVEKVSTRLAE